MKLSSPKLAASACLIAMLAVPLTGLANPRGYGDKDKDKDKGKKYAMAEPGTLAMTIAGLGLGMGLVVLGVRRNRKSATA
jgi:hypothetical protein